MATERSQIEVRGIQIEIVRKDIENLHVGVYPPRGRVRIAAPLHVDDEAVRLAVISRLAWIRRKRDRFEEQVRLSRREMVTGESHYYQGRRYRLDVIEEDNPPTVRVRNNTTMEVRVRPGSDREKRKAVLDRWYRQQLKEQIPALVEKWEPRVGVSVEEVNIKQMKTLWGSCNAEAGRIWLNLELIKKPTVCLEYILVHEMVHFLERNHNERFLGLMDELMPRWRLTREELNRAPLAHEEWEY